VGAAAEAVTTRPRRRPLTWRRTRRGAVPYFLIFPVLAVLAALLGYPLYQLVRLSFQQYQLPELIAHKGIYVGFANYTSVLRDGVFWHTLLRTILFTAACVSLTIVLGTLMALLLVRVSGWMRILITIGLILVWSMPPVVSVQVWNWMTDVQNGVFNYILTEIHFGDYFQHNWFATPFSQLAMVVSIVVWGALPFVAITTYAALSQVPHELMEAARIDGARSWQVFKDVTYPIIQPVLLILTSLSILWDFGVFTQAYLLIGQPHILPSNYLMSVYLWEEAYFKNDYGRGAAISILMLASVAILSLIYIRRMLKIGEVDR
jgi:N,N'-diacetylchitobiose transport system permease protein